MNSSEIYNILKNGSPEDRVRFIQSAPENSFKTYSLGMIGSDNLGMVVLALSSMILEYCNGRDPTFGSELAKATHSLAYEVYKSYTDHGGLLPTTLSGLASQYVNALNLLGRSEKVITFSNEYIPFYESLEEMENLPTLYCAKANALLNLNQIDAAEMILRTIDSTSNPGAKIEINRLLNKIAQLKDNIANIEPSGTVQQNIDLAGILKDALGSFGKKGEQLQSVFGEMLEKNKHNHLDPNDNEQFQKALDVLKKGEEFLTKNSDAENEWTMQGRMREATKIFKLEPHPAPHKIAASLKELTEVLEWAEKHQHMVLANDALWGIYLCYSRQNDDSKAADALIFLRTNLEQQRAGIEDPFERGGAFSTYPQLFNALCEKLQRSERYFELLEAMEASKGRGIADILTRQQGRAIADKDIYNSVSRLPLLTKKFKFHYLSYYIDRFDGEAIIHQVVVGKDGQVYGSEPVKLSENTLDAALANLDPKTWGDPDESNPGRKVEDASMQLSPLIDFLLRLMLKGVLEKGDHICYTADEDLNNMPLHYLPFRGERLIDWFSLSKIHNSLQLELILERSPSIPNKASTFVVPTLQNVKSTNWQINHTSLTVPAKVLGSYIPTDLMENEAVSVERLKEINLCNSVLHFSTHGVFPKKLSDNNPFANSGIVLSDGESLPDANLVARGDTTNLLSPKKIILNGIKMQDSHVTMMACVSGLSREGLGGDALGLDWALTQAGATSILASHWMVSAADAACFFKLFYTKWLMEKKSRGHAFCETVNELSSSGGITADAHCWAAFSLSGDWR